MIKPGKILATMALAAAALLAGLAPAAAQADSPSPHDRTTTERAIAQQMNDTTWG
ncbi:hypothetical protein ACFC26_37175 [Kitasatospora purpeofusca]|uniref:hypothetical protein n=1 Tax=Kitasatospora purpeofusca TaxID=67352 RepID=UPI0035E2DA02